MMTNEHTEASMTQVQRWTGVVSAHEAGGFVAYGDYLDLLDRLEKAEKDAERYRWLREHNGDGVVEVSMSDTDSMAAWIYGTDDLDDAVDRAMEASK